VLYALALHAFTTVLRAFTLVLYAVAFFVSIISA
jgi:hypothetical protein